MFEVKQSAIHGKGLFSTEVIKADTVLGYCETRPAKKLRSPYVLWRVEGPVEVTCNLKFINHSSKPNVAYYDDLSVVALKRISVGEELTHNYEQK